MSADPALAAAVRALAAQYGTDAAVVAVMRAAEEAARGDAEACDFWAKVGEALEAGEDCPGASAC